MGDMGDIFKAEKRERAQRAGIEVHNNVSDAQKAIADGDRVIVTKDNGVQVLTTARSAPFQASGNNGLWVIFVTGISGYYALCRVEPVGEKCGQCKGAGVDEEDPLMCDMNQEPPCPRCGGSGEEP